MTRRGKGTSPTVWDSGSCFASEVGSWASFKFLADSKTFYTYYVYRSEYPIKTHISSYLPCISSDAQVWLVSFPLQQLSRAKEFWHNSFLRVDIPRCSWIPSTAIKCLVCSSCYDGVWLYKCYQNLSHLLLLLNLNGIELVESRRSQSST